MRQGIIVNVTSADRARLRAVVANRNSPQKQVWRAKIILLTAEGLTSGIIYRIQTQVCTKRRTTGWTCTKTSIRMK